MVTRKTVAKRIAVGFVLAGALVPALAADAPANASASGYLAGQVVEVARQTLKDNRLSPDLAAKEAALLLSWAERLEAPGGTPETLRMLVEATRAANKPDQQKEALRKLISTDKGDLVAQVQYLDLLATSAQTLEERTRIYTSAMEQQNLDPQVRSEMALRLSELALERGNHDQQRDYLLRAVKLNDVNVAALRGLVRVAALDPRAVPERMTALVNLLQADPYQPDAWLELAKICASANLHGRASDYLGVALEQLQMSGETGSGEQYLDYALELAIAGRHREAAGILNALASLQDAPPTAMFAAQLISGAVKPPAGAAATTAPATTAPARVSERIEKVLVEMVSEGGSADHPSAPAPTAFADAAAVALTILPPGSPMYAQAGTWIDTYAKQVPADDPMLLRLRGWQSYRAGKLDEARTTLEKVAESDPMAAIGLARVLIAQNRNTEAARQLQEVWSAHPTGLLALQASEAARSANIKLQDTQWTRQLDQAAAKLPDSVLAAHQQPRDLQLVTVTTERLNVSLGEPLIINARIMNTSARPLPVAAARIGTPGAVATVFGLWAEMRRPDPKPIGLYAVEDVGRVFRLEARSTMEARLRVDQGSLAAALNTDPLQASTANVWLYTAPVLRANHEVAPGLGGQRLDAGDLTRMGLAFSTPADFESFVKQLPAAGTAPTAKSLAQIMAAGRMLQMMASPSPALAAVMGAGEKANATKQSLSGAFVSLTKSADPLVRCAVVLATPATSANADLDTALDALAKDADPLVRALWARRIAAKSGGSPAPIEQLRQRAAAEQDPAVAEWLAALIAQSSAPTTQPRP